MTQILAPSMLATLAFTLLIGFPVAFSLAAVASVFGLIGIATGHFSPSFLQAMAYRVQGVFGNDNFLAIPLLVFMGMLMERTGIADDMFRSVNRCSGLVREGSPTALSSSAHYFPRLRASCPPR